MTAHQGLLAAVAQFAPTASAEENKAAATSLIAEAAARGAELIVLPEYANYYSKRLDATFAENAEGLDGPFVELLTRSAAGHGVTIVSGLVERGEGEHCESERVHNTALAVGSQGVLARYRKQHLYDAYGQQESRWVEAGEIRPPDVFELGGLRFGLLTCYDLRFPEVGRTLVNAGADAILVPAAWIRGPLKESQFSTLLSARAIENTVYMLAADHHPPIGIGHSAIVDPEGVTIGSAGTQPGLALARLDPETIERVRKASPVLCQRRYRTVAASASTPPDKAAEAAPDAPDA